MKIKILHLLAGARKAKGLTVIIDVFRAFSVACYLFNNGVKKIIPVGDIEVAHRLKKQNSDYILIGERDGKIQPGFDYGNSPTRIENINFAGKTVVHTTGAGTQGIVKARRAGEIITGSFVNVGAIINYISLQKPKIVSLVCMGKAGEEKTAEDIYCAEYIKNKLENKATDYKEMVAKLRKGSGSRFFDKTKDWSPERDFELCLDLNRFNFILRVEPFRKGLVCLKKGWER
jgi:2-phosphosulfolactate phosphatase